MRLSLGLLVFLLAGCSSGMSREATAPPGFTIRTVEDPALSLALPEDWRSSVRSGDSRSALKLIASAPPPERGAFLASMNVAQTRVPASLTFEQLATREARQIEATTPVADLRQRETRLPAGRALRLTYRLRMKVLMQQYYVLDTPLLYILTYTRPSDSPRAYAKIFDQSAHTFDVG